ncbi:Vacuolar protein sorting-associated protein 24 1 [Glycine soja]
MEKVMNILKPKPNPQQLLRDWQRRLRQECRNIERQIRDIQREEKNVQKAIREAAKRNDMGSAKALAKELVRSRKTVNRLYENKAQMNSISMHLGESVGLSERSLSLTVYGIVVVKQFVSGGKIVANCICRTPDAILNLLERPSIPTHDAVLYYNGRWNMPRQNNFVGNAFTGINPPKFDIPKGCTIDELKDLIKQVAPKGNPPHGIHESQLVRRLFYRQPAHLEYSDKVLKFEIIELKSDDDVLKVLVESNYWKQFVPIEILALFSKVVLENDDKVVTSLHV